MDIQKRQQQLDDINEQIRVQTSLNEDVQNKTDHYERYLEEKSREQGMARPGERSTRRFRPIRRKINRGKTGVHAAAELERCWKGRSRGSPTSALFVELPGGKTGMVHISEVAPTYVKEIRDYVTENQTVKVKVLSIGDDGRVSLSIKKAMEQPRGTSGARRFLPASRRL